MQVSKVLIEASEICNYIPVVSTISNIVNLFLKCIADCLPDNIFNNAYRDYVQDLSHWRCVKASIPVIGNIKIFLEDRSAYQENKTKMLKQVNDALALPYAGNRAHVKTLTEDQVKLFVAIVVSDSQTVKALLEKKVPLDFSVHGMTPLCIACALNCSLEIVGALIVAGENPNTPVMEGFPLSVVAAKWGRQDIVKLLIEKGADITKRSPNGEDALQMAIMQGHVELLPILMKKDEKIDDRRYQLFYYPTQPPLITDLTPLVFAACLGQVKSAVNLLKLSDLKQLDSLGRTALHYSIRCDMELFIAILRKDRSVDFIDQADSNGETPLLWAIAHKKTAMALKLLELGADPFKIVSYKVLNGNAEEESSMTPFSLACRLGLTDVFSHIKKHKTLTDHQKAMFTLSSQDKNKEVHPVPDTKFCMMSIPALDIAVNGLNFMKSMLETYRGAPRTGMEILNGKLL